MPSLIPEEKAWKAVNLHRDRPTISIAEIARECIISRSGVRGILKRFEDTGSPMVQKTPRINQRILSPNQVQTLVQAVEAEPFTPLRTLKRRLSLPASESTLNRRLKEVGINVYRPAKKPKLSEFHKEERLEFAARNLATDWSKVMFSDECAVSSAQGTGLNFVRRHRGERYEQRNIQAVQHSGRESVAVWASFTMDGPKEIVRVQGKLNQQQYINRILSRHVTPHFLKPENADYLFQQDNSPVHTAIHVTQYLERKGVKFLKWPSCSPDLNPIENYWNVLKREIGEVDLPKGSADVKKDFLWNLVQSKWNELKETRGPEIISNYYATMHTRLAAVRIAGGGSTKY